MPHDDRFSLRFETGDRRGEAVAIPESGLTVGRRPGNTLVIADASVSGRHAELSVDGEGVLLRDLGSTNGTRVGAERVLEQRLEDGDVVLFGNVRLVFRDALSEGPRLEGEEDAPVLAAPAPAAARAAEEEGVERVQARLVEQAARRSPGAAIGLGAVVLLAAGVGAWLWLGRGQGSDGATAAVELIPGNRIQDGYSFEGDRDTWEASEGAPSAFLLNAAARRSGGQGVRADLAPGEWALSRSPEFRVNAEREVTARAALRVRGEVAGRLGVEFHAPEGAEPAPAPVTAWAAPLEGAAGWSEVALTAGVPPGYGRARVVLLARTLSDEAGGAVDADDASAVEAPAQVAPAAEVASTGLYLHGDPPITAHLVRVDRVFATGIELTRAGAAPGREGARLVARADGPRIVLAAEGARPDVLVLRAEDALVRGGIATIGEGGYRTHGVTTEREKVTSVLLGAGRDLVELELSAPCTVRGAREGSGVRLVVELAGASEVALQLDFSADKGAAEDLAHAARGVEKRGELGAAIARWGELLDRFPYEQALVEEAEATRARLTGQGLAGLRELRAEAERARSFGLAEMLRATRERALALAQRYQGSDVATDAGALAEELAREAAARDVDKSRAERERLSAMLRALEARGAAGLAAELREALSRMEGGS